MQSKTKAIGFALLRWSQKGIGFLLLSIIPIIFDGEFVVEWVAISGTLLITAPLTTLRLHSAINRSYFSINPKSRDRLCRDIQAPPLIAASILGSILGVLVELVSKGTVGPSYPICFSAFGAMTVLYEHTQFRLIADSRLILFSIFASIPTLCTLGATIIIANYFPSTKQPASILAASYLTAALLTASIQSLIYPKCYWPPSLLKSALRARHYAKEGAGLTAICLIQSAMQSLPRISLPLWLASFPKYTPIVSFWIAISFSSVLAGKIIYESKRSAIGKIGAKKDFSKMNAQIQKIRIAWSLLSIAILTSTAILIMSLNSIRPDISSQTITANLFILCSLYIALEISLQLKLETLIIQDRTSEALKPLIIGLLATSIATYYFFTIELPPHYLIITALIGPIIAITWKKRENAI
jgi:hypothetical protein